MFLVAGLFMAEISSLMSSPKSVDFAALADRDERGRKGDADATPFGQMVSVQARPAQANGRAAPPAQLDRPAEKPVQPSNPRDEAPVERADDSTSRSALVDRRRASDDERPIMERDHRTNASDDECPACEMNAPANDHAGVSAEPSENTPGHCGGPAELQANALVAADELPAGVQAEPIELPVVPLAESVELPVAVASSPAGPSAIAIVAPAETLIAGNATVDAETEAVIAALGAVGQGGKSTKVSADIAVPETAMPTDDAPSASPAEAFGKLASKGLEAQPAGRPAGGEAPAKAPAADLPRTNFGDWINDFAVSQGALHRSGDLVGSLDRALSALPTPHMGQDALRPTPLQMLPIEIGMQAMRGVTKFQIRLDPAELGRVDVQLEIKEDGQVRASLVVDRVETLAMLKRDASTLQQAFEQAGLRQSADGLQFSLRGEGQQREGQRDGEPRRAWTAEDEKLMGEMPPEIAMRRVMIPNSSLDLMV